MLTPSTIYWLTRLDHIDGAVFLLVGIPILIAAAITFIAHEETKDIVFKKICNIAFAIGCATSSIGIAIEVFLPTTKELAAIMVIPKIANSESVQQLGDGIVDLANQWLRELAPKKEPTE